MSKLEIRGMREADWPAVSALIETEWETSHPVLDKDFFFWQHRGFGRNRGLSATPLAFIGSELVGMRGVIPGDYQLPQEDGSYRYASGGAFAMWIVARAHRGTGVGKQLLAYCGLQLPVMVALGSNEKTSVPIYLKNGFSRLSGLHHWYVLLCDRAEALLFGPPQSRNVFNPLNPSERSILHVTTDAEYLEDVWDRFSKLSPVFSLHRTAGFWRWRYLEHPVFKYEVLCDPDSDAFSVHRVEEVETIEGPIRVLRILELCVGESFGSQAHSSSKLAQFLNTLLSEKLDDGLAAVDFRASSLTFHRALEMSGFALMEHGQCNDESQGFAGQLNPLRLHSSPINLHWKTAKGFLPAPSDLLFTKSDSDMDRPNIRGIRSKRLQ